jgi:hypothetical protein
MTFNRIFPDLQDFQAWNQQVQITKTIQIFKALYEPWSKNPRKYRCPAELPKFPILEQRRPNSTPPADGIARRRHCSPVLGMNYALPSLGKVK